jgi:aromatic ring-opening dioxygenase catalytic subunit (LigB family)
MAGETVSPVLYIPHGGGPLPLLGDPGHKGLADFLKNIVTQISKPASILIISAHWEEKFPTLTSGSHPELIYDYSGFPEESYHIQYNAPGDPQLAQDLLDLIQAAGGQAKLDDRRGFDHGMFVPLKLMYPDAQIPCVQLSLIKGLDPASHIALGKSLSAIRSKNVLIVGSGLSFHNLRAFFSPAVGSGVESEAFDQWLTETCTSPNLSAEEREQRLIDWEQAPHARFCHPREEHLLPLQVCYGAACAESPRAEVVFNQELMGRRVSGFIW